MTTLRRCCAGLLAGGAVVLVAACNEARETGAVSSRATGMSSTVPGEEAFEDREVALVRVVNAVPGGGPVSVWAGNIDAFDEVAYRHATPYRPVPAVRAELQLTAADASPGDVALAKERKRLRKGDHYTIVALPAKGGSEKRELRVLEDDLKPVSPEKARVRFINGVPGEDQVDLSIHGRPEPLFDGVDFKQAAGWKSFDPMAGPLEVRPDNGRSVIASLPDVRLEGGKSYTFVLSGTPGMYEIIRIEDVVGKSEV